VGANAYYYYYDYDRYGFNSHGHAVVAERLKIWPDRKGDFPSKLVGVNLGKNKTSRDACTDYVGGVRMLGPHVDYIVVNVSSPNTPGLRDMQGKKQLESLLDMVKGFCKSLYKITSSSLPPPPPTLVRCWKSETSCHVDRPY